jgi:hypothetical protein
MTSVCETCGGVGTRGVIDPAVARWKCPTCRGTGDGVARDRAEHESCERGTPGCSVHHRTDSPCQPW